MRIIIAGSRGFSDYEFVKERIEDLLRLGELKPAVILSGGAGGIDRMGERWAKENNLPVELFAADWATYGKKAGPIRNAQMAKSADAAVVIWDGKSLGTKSLLKEAMLTNLRVLLYVNSEYQNKV